MARKSEYYYAQSANLIARGTTTLLTLDIHKVSDREEAVTSRLLQRILQETHIGVAFLSYVVKPATRAGAADSVRRIAERLLKLSSSSTTRARLQLT